MRSARIPATEGPRIVVKRNAWKARLDEVTNLIANAVWRLQVADTNDPKGALLCLKTAQLMSQNAYWEEAAEALYRGAEGLTGIGKPGSSPVKITSPEFEGPEMTPTEVSELFARNAIYIFNRMREAGYMVVAKPLGEEDPYEPLTYMSDVFRRLDQHPCVSGTTKSAMARSWKKYVLALMKVRDDDQFIVAEDMADVCLPINTATQKRAVAKTPLTRAAKAVLRELEVD